MITVKNRFQKVLFRVKNDRVVNQSGKQLATLGENALLNDLGEEIVKIDGTNVISIEDGSTLAVQSGSEIKDAEGTTIGYVDGKPFSHFPYGAAALVMFAY